MPGAVPPPQPGTTPLRGRRPIRIAIVLFVLAVAGFVAGAVTANQSFSKVNGFQRIPIATSPSNVSPQNITFSKPGGYIAYYEASDVSNSITKIPEPQVVLISPSHQQLDLTVPYGNRSDNKIKLLTYDYNGHHGVAVWQFHISETGTYQAVAGYENAPADARMAFGTSIAKGAGIGAALIGVAVLLLIVAIILLIIGLVKRSRHKKQLAAATGYGAYPPPGYQQGGYPQGSYGQGGPTQGGYGQGGYAPPPPAGYGEGAPQGGAYPPPPPGSGYPPPSTGSGYPPPPPGSGYGPSAPTGENPPHSGYEPPAQQ